MKREPITSSKYKKHESRIGRKASRLYRESDGMHRILQKYLEISLRALQEAGIVLGALLSM